MTGTGVNLLTAVEMAQAQTGDWVKAGHIEHAVAVAKWTNGTPAAFSFDPADVFPAANTLFIASHAFVDNLPVQVSSSGTLPAGLAASTTYYISDVATDHLQLLDAPGGSVVAFTDAGSGTHTITPVAYAPEFEEADVDVGNDEIDITGHGFVAAEPVQLSTTDTLPGGLSIETTYFVLVASANAIQLEASVGGGAITLTDDGTGTHTITRFSAADAIEKVAPDGDEILEAGHGLATGSVGQFTTATTLPAGLSLATNYYAIVKDDNRFQVATSLANALAGTAVNITDQGTGEHTFTPTALSCAAKLQGAVTPGEPTEADAVDVPSGAFTIPGSGPPLPLSFANLGYLWLRAVSTPTAGNGPLTLDIGSRGGVRD